jgi:hypothetical protein
MRQKDFSNKKTKVGQISGIYIYLSHKKKKGRGLLGRSQC